MERGKHWWRWQLVTLLSITWLPLLVLSAVSGQAWPNSDGLMFLADPIPYARLLIALPLFVLAAPMVARRTAEVVTRFDAPEQIADSDLPKWRDAVRGMKAAAGSKVAIAVILVLIVTATLLQLASHTESPALSHDSAASWFLRGPAAGDELSWAGLWYTVVSGPVFLFYAYRWMWRGLVWVWFLNRLSRMDLGLQATHSDHAGGLLILGRTPSSFLGVGVAFAASMSGNIGHEITLGAATFHDERLGIVLYVVIAVILVYGPLLQFTGKLVRVREQGLLDYGRLGSALSIRFRERWIDPPDIEQKKILDQADPSAVADYAAVYDTILGMRVIPIVPRTLIAGAALMTLPFVPLVLFELSLHDAMTRLLGVLT